MDSLPNETFGNFDLVKRVKLDFTDVCVEKWKSRRTGLSVVHIDYDSPLVNLYAVVGTEIFDDSGCPHTLEHLVFMGSEKFPYKGIIDHFANRGFSEGTNAWTDTDHTAYTVSTAGEQGFLQLLPIYVDHILYPTFTTASFMTEVYHIDSTGEDAGVVYSEMQGRENTSGDLMALRAQRLSEPIGSAYRSDTGGLMEALRVLTVEEIRKYHDAYYVPHNLSLIVAGKLSEGTRTLLSLIQDKVESSIIAHKQDRGPRPPGWKRPFVETTSAGRGPIAETIKDTVEFPEEDESVGELLITFAGPPPNAFLERKALDIIGLYLTSSAVAPLDKEYIEIDSPLCTDISFAEDTGATRVCLTVYVDSVPVEHLDDFDEKLKTSLRRIVTQGIDMERMAMVINRDERQLRSELESDKGDVFSGTVITDFLYGAEDGSDLEAALDEIQRYKALRDWTSKQWTDLLRRYYIDANAIVIRGKPSASLATKLDKDEKARIAARVKKLGKSGLKLAEKALEDAKAEHDRPIPTEVLLDFAVPDVKSISFIPVASTQEPGTGRSKTGRSLPAEKLERHVQSDGPPLPFFVQYDHVESEFVTIQGYFSLEKLPDRLRPLVSVYLAAFFALPIVRSTGERLTHEQVVNKLDDETVSYEAELGTGSAFAENVRVTIECESANYESAIAWMRDLLYGAEFNKERLQVTISKIQQSLPEMKREGDTVLESLWSNLLFAKSSLPRAAGLLPQIAFIRQVSKLIKDDPEQVIADMADLRRHVIDPAGVRFSVAGNVLKLAKPRSPWAKYFSAALPETPLSPVPLSSATLSELGKNPIKKAFVLSLPTIESSYATHVSKAISGFNHPEYPAFRVALEVLNASESYLWRYIRGSGLAYGAYVALDLEAGLSYFELYRSSNSMDAFKEAAKVIRGLVDGSIALETTTLDAAKCTIIFSIANNVSDVASAAAQSFRNQALRGLSQTHQIELLEQYQAVSKEDVLEIMRKYFLPLFDASSSVAVVVTSPKKQGAILKGLAACGFEVEKRTLEDSS